ncbi:DciA family protein [Xinfangfangia sp. CPCC 101601]|uniref:DciA family protein n=1 Tax=Pseudogemmobacter lacusdianii TaxID=3069608 RepID=A0ABU0VXD0_9RHOB|nr:DciA family protein [Xinfangfangia sp. CPCC 101601]MDQ2066393.1 DciA family protein [Xinfangfangia sp. CPCC 101601]
MRGFEPAFAMMAREVRAAGESRGFAVAKLLTHWEEVAGPEIAAVTRPVKVGYGREGMGASLTLLVRGAAGPMVEMQKDALRARVNAVYGYNAIVRILLTQTSATGFAEGQAQFVQAPKAPPPPDPAVLVRVQDETKGVADEGLRAALERMGQNILTRQKAAEDKR